MKISLMAGPARTRSAIRDMHARRPTAARSAVLQYMIRAPGVSHAVLLLCTQRKRSARLAVVLHFVLSTATAVKIENKKPEYLQLLPGIEGPSTTGSPSGQKSHPAIAAAMKEPGRKVHSYFPARSPAPTAGGLCSVGTSTRWSFTYGPCSKRHSLKSKSFGRTTPSIPVGKSSVVRAITA